MRTIRKQYVQKRKIRAVFVTLLFFFILSGVCYQALAQANNVPLNWLENIKHDIEAGVSWGVPFSKGEVQPGDSFSLTSDEGVLLPVQSWPMAYWPDGTLELAGKWIPDLKEVEEEEYGSK